MTIDPISSVAMMSSVMQLNYFRGNALQDSQKQKGNNSVSSVNNAVSSGSIVITDKLELSSGSLVGISEENLSNLVTMQPQLNPNAPVNKSQSAFQSILNAKKQLSVEELSATIEDRKKSAQKAREEEDRKKAAQAGSGSGYVLTIPPSHLEEMSSYSTGYPERNRLYNTFNAYQNTRTGSLVNLTV